MNTGPMGTNSVLPELILGNMASTADDYDHLFTPAVIAELDGIAAKIKAGGITYSIEEVHEHFTD